MFQKDAYHITGFLILGRLLCSFLVCGMLCSPQEGLQSLGCSGLQQFLAYWTYMMGMRIRIMSKLYFKWSLISQT